MLVLVLLGDFLLVGASCMLIGVGIGGELELDLEYFVNVFLFEGIVGSNRDFLFGQWWIFSGEDV